MSATMDAHAGHAHHHEKESYRNEIYLFSYDHKMISKPVPVDWYLHGLCWL